MTIPPIATAALVVLVLALLGAVLAVPVARRRHARFAGTPAQLQRVAGDSRVGDVLPAGRGRRGNGRTPIPGAALQAVVAALPAPRLVDLVGEDHPVSGTGRHRRGLVRPRTVADLPDGYWAAYLAGVDLPVTTGAGERFFAAAPGAGVPGAAVPTIAPAADTAADPATATATEVEMSEPAAPVPARPAVPAQRPAPARAATAEPAADVTEVDAAVVDAPEAPAGPAAGDAPSVPSRPAPAPAGTRRGRLSLPFLSRSAGRDRSRVMAPRPPAALRPDLAGAGAEPATVEQPAVAAAPPAPVPPPAVPAPQPARTPDVASPAVSTTADTPSEAPMTTPAEQSPSRWFDDAEDGPARPRRTPFAAQAAGDAGGWWNAAPEPVPAPTPVAGTPAPAPRPASVPVPPAAPEPPRPAGRKVAIVDIGVAPAVRPLHEPVPAEPVEAVVAQPVVARVHADVGGEQRALGQPHRPLLLQQGLEARCLVGEGDAGRHRRGQ